MGKIRFYKKEKLRISPSPWPQGLLRPIRLEDARGEVSLLGSHYLRRKHESFLRKDAQKEQARGVQHQTNPI